MSFLHLLGFEKNLKVLKCQQTLEKQTSQLSLVMKTLCMGTQCVSVAIN